MPRKTKEVKQDTKIMEEKSNKKVAKSASKTLNKEINETKNATSKSTKKSIKGSSKAKSSSKTSRSTVKTSEKSVKGKSTSKSKSSTKSSASKNSKIKENKKEMIVNEYYDLPYRYNQTIVKVLAQTPNNLFIYWDISDEDRNYFKNEYGDDFFEKTRPVLIVHNDTLNYSFEVGINDFANSWYLHVNDSKSDYRIELGRRPIDYYRFNEDLKNMNNDIHYNIDYIQITNSNEIESPNDRILFNPNENMVYYRNVKTNETISKPITSLSFMHNIGKIYNIYELYKQIYKEENIEDLYDLKNPSSGNPSSGQLPSSNIY